MDKITTSPWTFEATYGHPFSLPPFPPGHSQQAWPKLSNIDKSVIMKC